MDLSPTPTWHEAGRRLRSSSRSRAIDGSTGNCTMCRPRLVIDRRRFSCSIVSTSSAHPYPIAADDAAPSDATWITGCRKNRAARLSHPRPTAGRPGRSIDSIGARGLAGRYISLQRTSRHTDGHRNNMRLAGGESVVPAASPQERK